MTSSGTYAFNPSLGSLVIYALNICGVRSAAITQEHMSSANMAANLLLADWANKGPNLWKVDLVTVPLVEGVSVYPVDPQTVVMLDTYIRTTVDGVNTDRIILPVSRTEYASYPNKQQQGFPTVYWQDRLINGNVTLWPVPDGTQTSLIYYRFLQIQDANYTSGQTLDIPYVWLNAFAKGLAFELALLWNPGVATALKQLADQAYQTAADQNVETSNFYVSPQMAGYWR